MAEPPDPTMPSGPDDGADGWVRPSQRRASRPPSGPPHRSPLAHGFEQICLDERSRFDLAAQNRFSNDG